MSKGPWKRKVAGKGSVAAAVITGQPVEQRFDEGPAVDDNFLGEMSDLLETPFYTLNKMIPAFRERRVSQDARHWYVKWFFPNAEGGPVYVDYPRSKHDMEICQQKAKIMSELKLSYKLFRPEEDERLQVARVSTGMSETEAEIPAGESF